MFRILNLYKAIILISYKNTVERRSYFETLLGLLKKLIHVISIRYKLIFFICTGDINLSEVKVLFCFKKLT